MWERGEHSEEPIELAECECAITVFPLIASSLDQAKQSWALLFLVVHDAWQRLCASISSDMMATVKSRRRS